MRAEVIIGQRPAYEGGVRPQFDIVKGDGQFGLPQHFSRAVLNGKAIFVLVAPENAHRTNRHTRRCQLPAQNVSWRNSGCRFLHETRELHIVDERPSNQKQQGETGTRNGLAREARDNFRFPISDFRFFSLSLLTSAVTLRELFERLFEFYLHQSCCHQSRSADHARNQIMQWNPVSEAKVRSGQECRINHDPHLNDAAPVDFPFSAGDPDKNHPAAFFADVRKQC